MFTRAELEIIAALCQEFDALAITDEIYEHILYDGARHIPIATLPGMRERTLIVNSMSKTWSVTGWRIGWVLGPADISDAVRKVHDFLTVGAAAPLQQAGVLAMNMGDEYYERLAREYRERRDHAAGRARKGRLPLLPSAAAPTTSCATSPPSASRTTSHSPCTCWRTSASRACPAPAFSSSPTARSQLIRFCFCKRHETLEAAGERLAKL